MAPSEEEQANELETRLTDDERALLDNLADGLAKRRLGAPALFFLESGQAPRLRGLAGHALLRPMVQAVISSPVKWDRVTKLLERRGAIELLLRRLEARA